jgi:anti-anti-sigma factor
MPITEWSEDILIAELSDEPSFSDDLNALVRRLDSARGKGDGGTPDVILNLKGVTYLNSSNIAQLLRVRQMLANAGGGDSGGGGGRLRLCSVGDQVWSVLLITGLDKFFDFTGDVATSLASLQIEEERD